jgi:prefoldin subunit 5
MPRETLQQTVDRLRRQRAELLKENERLRQKIEDNETAWNQVIDELSNTGKKKCEPKSVSMQSGTPLLPWV